MFAVVELLSTAVDVMLPHMAYATSHRIECSVTDRNHKEVNTKHHKFFIFMPRNKVCLTSIYMISVYGMCTCSRRQIELLHAHRSIFDLHIYAQTPCNNHGFTLWWSYSFVAITAPTNAFIAHVFTYGALLAAIRVFCSHLTMLWRVLL